MQQNKLRIGIIGDYDSTFPPHRATNTGIAFAASHLGLEADVTWIATDSVPDHAHERLNVYDALWCAPGSPYRSMEGALRAIQFARENAIPFLGTCGGFQHVVLEYARNVLNFRDAAHAEYDPFASTLFVSALSCSLVGQQMTVHVKPGTRVARIYERVAVEEMYYCNFGLNPEYQDLFENDDLQISGVDQAGEVRILEGLRHPYFIATLFVPQLTSTAEKPHPLIIGLLQAAEDHSRQKSSFSPSPQANSRGKGRK